jgi:hypothetical protein
VTRFGLNCTLSYLRGSSTYVYQVRCNGVTHGVAMVSDESQARSHRAFYPHRVAPQRFAITVQLVGWDERRSFTNWMASYASYAIDPDLAATSFPSMTVNAPSRSFLSKGVPLEGYEWGDHIGSLVFQPTIVFEPAISPGQTAAPDTSAVDNKWSSFAKDPAIQYFYPIGTQLGGDSAPGVYDHIVYPGDPSQFNDEWGQPLPGGVPNGGDISPTK